MNAYVLKYTYFFSKCVVMVDYKACLWLGLKKLWLNMCEQDQPHLQKHDKHTRSHSKDWVI